jgi:hypothetical protein
MNRTLSSFVGALRSRAGRLRLGESSVLGARYRGAAMSTTIVPKDEQDASVLAEVPPPPCECFNELMPQPNGVIGKSTKRCCRATPSAP